MINSSTTSSQHSKFRDKGEFPISIKDKKNCLSHLFTHVKSVTQSNKSKTGKKSLASSSKDSKKPR
jgi:hypothetical protein